MNLREFLHQSLVDIVSAVKEAKVEDKPICLPLARMSDEKGPRGQYGQTPQFIEFDIAVTAERDSKIEGEAKGALISVLSAGVDASMAERHESVSRIKFKVPVTFD